MCRSQKMHSSGGLKMSRASSAVKPCFLVIAGIMLLAGLCFSQEKPKKPKSTENKPPAATQPLATQEMPSQPTAAASEEEERPKGPWHGLTWRLVGPFRGGRSLAVSGVVGDAHTYYFGGVAGGVWKTTDGGLTWRPMTDKTRDMSPAIGAIAVAPSDPNVIYAGTGETCIRGNIVGGNGVFKSIDAGKTWSYVGLRDTHAVGRIIVHSKNPDIAFVAALGHPFGPNPERGIFRTTDGGKNWSKVLYKDENTGGIDLAFDPNNSSIIFAGLWQARRSPWSMDSGGPGSGLYRRTDGRTARERLSRPRLTGGTTRR